MFGMSAFLYVPTLWVQALKASMRIAFVKAHLNLWCSDNLCHKYQNLVLAHLVGFVKIL